MLKILFVTQDDPFYIPEFFKEFDRIFNDPEIKIEGVVIQAPLGKKSIGSLIKQMLDFYGPVNFTGLGFRFAVNKVLNSIAIKLFKGKFPGACSVEHYLLKHNWKIIKTNNVNSPEFISMVKAMNLDLIVSAGASQKFKKTILNTPKFGCINIHNSKLPKTRGMLPSFWSLLNYDVEPTTAMTVFKMDEALDSGDIILQWPVKLDPKESLEELIIRTKKENAHILAEALNLYKNGEPPLLPNDDSQATYFSFPTKEDVKKFKAKGLKLI
jgi:methionyl-tRNA formyltransferase